nr:MAG TPA: Protein Rep68-Associated Virus, HUH nuclease, DNA.3A [Caudoviricetes sp.]
MTDIRRKGRGQALHLDPRPFIYNYIIIKGL